MIRSFHDTVTDVLSTVNITPSTAAVYEERQYWLENWKHIVSRGLSSVDTTTEVELPGPTLVKALTEKVNSVPSSRSLCVVKLVARSVVFNLVSGCDKSVGL